MIAFLFVAIFEDKCISNLHLNWIKVENYTTLLKKD
jgi:hypothetical protein